MLDVKSARGADCDTDHILVVVKMKVTLKNTRSSKKIGPKGRFDIQKLDEPIFRDMYQSRIDRKIRSQSLGWENKGIEERWENLKSVIQDTTEETIRRKRRVKKPWFNKICEEAIQRRKIAKNNWLNDTDNREKLTQYRTTRKRKQVIYLDARKENTYKI